MSDTRVAAVTVPTPPRYVARPFTGQSYGVFDTFTQTFVKSEQPGPHGLVLRAVIRRNSVYVRCGLFNQEESSDSAAW